MNQDSGLPVDRAYAYLILRSSRLLRFHFQAMTASLGIELSPEQWLILNRLMLDDSVPQSQLIDETFRDRPNVSRMLKSLEAKELITRLVDRTDGRKYLVQITAKGKRTHRKLVPEIKRQRRLVYKGLTTKHFEVLKEILDTIDENILNGEFG